MKLKAITYKRLVAALSRIQQKCRRCHTSSRRQSRIAVPRRSFLTDSFFSSSLWKHSEKRVARELRTCFYCRFPKTTTEEALESGAAHALSENNFHKHNQPFQSTSTWTTMDSIIINNNKYEVNETKEKDLDVEEDDIEVCLTHYKLIGTCLCEWKGRDSQIKNEMWTI